MTHHHYMSITIIMIRQFVSSLRSFYIYLAQTHSTNNLFQLLIFVTKVTVALILSFTFGNYLASLRNPYLIASTRELLSLINTANFPHLIHFLVKKYYFYGLIALVLLLSCVFTLYKSIQTMKKISINTVKAKLIAQIITIILLLFWVNIVKIQTAEYDYSQFYATFNKGEITSTENNTSRSQYPGFRKYHFLNHKAQTYRLFILQLQQRGFKEIQENQEQALKLKQLLQLQQKSLSNFRSYLANYKLLFTLTNICYPYLMGISVVGLLLALLIFWRIMSHHCSSKVLNYHSIQQSQQDQQNPSQSNLKISRPFTVCYVLIFTVFGLLIAFFLFTGDIIIELRAGLRRDNNKQQQQLCTFHNMIGGFYINLNYQHQLDIAKIVDKMQLRTTNSSELTQKLGFYTSFCETLSPLYVESKQLQLNLGKILYSNFFCWLYLFYLMIQLRPNEQAETLMST